MPDADAECEYNRGVDRVFGWGMMPRAVRYMLGQRNVFSGGDGIAESASASQFGDS